MELAGAPALVQALRDRAQKFRETAAAARELARAGGVRLLTRNNGSPCAIVLRYRLASLIMTDGVHDGAELYLFAAHEERVITVVHQTRGYDGILSAATYATSTVPQFKTEGQYAVEARDLTWAKGYEIFGAVLSGQRPMPTIEEVFAELPELVWPS